jgi:hypothetical protein
MEFLNEQLDHLVKRLEDSGNFINDLDKLKSVYPFSKYEYIISKLLAANKLTFDEYLEIRDEYIHRNLFLYVFEISSPRGFGDTWAFSHLISVESDLKRPSKKIDPSYRGEYDLYLDWTNEKDDLEHYIKIEVKASRATDRQRPDEYLYIKALHSESINPFLMNFQQLKPKCADVFLWIAVYRDTLKYWVINADAVQNSKHFTPQHRNEETALRENDYEKTAIYEGQIMLTNQNANDFANYITFGKSLKNNIITQYKLQKGLK